MGVGPVTSRITARFAELREARRAGLVIFLTAGDPDPATSFELIAGLPAAGADMIEIGMPFTDPWPMAPRSRRRASGRSGPGPTWPRPSTSSAASARWTAYAPRADGLLQPDLRLRHEHFLADAKAAGADGLIVVDLPPEEDAELCLPARAHGLDFIRLATPTTDDRRLPAVLQNTSGFIYYVSVAGITGQKAAVAEMVAPEVARIKRRTDLPVAVGFGIREPEQAAAIAGIADAAVVGSALVDLVTRNLDAAGRPTPELVPAVHAKVRRAGRRRARGAAMSWLTDYVRPKIRALYTREKPEVPENLWHQCPSCERMIFHRDLDANQRVCPHCDHHMRVGPDYRFASLFDEGSWQRLEMPEGPADPLQVPRPEEVRRPPEGGAGQDQGGRRARGGPRAGSTACRSVIAVMNFEFMGGSMGTSLGEGFVAAAPRAVKERAAFIVVTASGGARMQEGALSLMQMARTTVAVEEVKEAGLPYIVILTDPTTGGVTASFAMIGDVHLAEPGAMIGFAGARVIEQTIREKLPEGFQRAEYLLAHGMVDQVVHRFELRPTLARLLDLLLRPDRAADARVITDVPPGQVETAAALQRRRARRTRRMTSPASDLILARLQRSIPKASISRSAGSSACWRPWAIPSGDCRRSSTSPAPTARAARWPCCPPCCRRAAGASTATSRPTSCASTSGS